jgi:hypothetical protein
MKWNEDVFEHFHMFFSKWDSIARYDTGKNIQKFSNTVEFEFEMN